VKVLVTGTDGYIGTVLPEVLMARGHHVLGVDTGFYKAGWLYSGVDRTAETLVKDIRKLTRDDLVGFDAVVHLAELSNDPVGRLAPHITYEINHQGSVHLAMLARDAGVTRFVYMSSCSVYGVATEALVDESSEVNPQTAYADCKRLVERDVKPLAGDDFSPTFLRSATAFGASPRMRFDIVVNNLSGLAWTVKEIRMESDGTPWRPFVHIRDICTAIACTLEAPREVIHSEVFNLGATDANYRVREVAEIIADVFPGCETTFGEMGADTRSYRVSFNRIHERLPGFSCEWDVRRGAEELHEVFERVGLDSLLFEFRGYTRLAQIRYLIDTGQIDSDFYWVGNGAVRRD
jgi:nucleoside-diphosphate-sugar epimerase